MHACYGEEVEWNFYSSTDSNFGECFGMTQLDL